MSETRTDTTQQKQPPQGTATAGSGDMDGLGKHRGGAAPAEDSTSPAYGRHRRPEEGRNAA
ncbi:hypothetical protein AB0P17_31870 [Streptomyces sp. NPDC088124]|uniref:hypothetical protein n=1 Tax=Streptomyces sp. NPDC088124 TaxID=3154654 RepID=UPI0034142129